MEKVLKVQKNCRDNVKTFETYLTDLHNWEAEMKRKEAALNGEFEQDLPPVRSKIKKEKPVLVKKKPEKRISAFDYNAWDKFDVDKACEEVDMSDVGPPSLDSTKSRSAKEEKLREEAQYEKERGNNFVKQEKWDEAIACYNRAIELVKDDAIYYANRGLCYLKKESLHQAESDCTEALRLDPTYVKAFQRRASARERLGSLRAASNDLVEVLKLEPHNNLARKQLETIKIRMGTKGSKLKSSPSATPTWENRPIVITPEASHESRAKIIELPDEPKPQVDKKLEQPKGSETAMKMQSESVKWRHGVGEDVTVIKTVKKPPHLRSKRSLVPVPIYEIPLGKESPEEPASHQKILEIQDDLSFGDTNNNDSNKINKIVTIIDDHGDKKNEIGNGDEILIESDNLSPKSDNLSQESEKLVKESTVTEKDDSVKNLVPPVNSVQFMGEWKSLRGKDVAKSHYLSIIEPSKIPSIFDNALESDILSEMLRAIAANTDKFKEKSVTAYLKGLCSVKRFSALAMFLNREDKGFLTKLLEHCKTEENCPEEDIADLKNKYEL